jgi:4-diphosphocytidyl-2-C-methyl-D-erythritol kinase
VIELVAPAKLTLTLRVVGVRGDGLHLIDAEMVTLDLHDRLVVDAAASTTRVDAIGPAAPADGLGADDLVARALRFVGRTASVTVHKAIPAGAGLGGGSADAAAILRWAGWDDAAAAAALGADVPFCLVGGRARVGGIGEVLDPLPYRPATLTLLTPQMRCSTPAVYRRWDELGGPADPSGNDLTPAALDLEPELARWRDRLAEETGTGPRLAGSGSTWFVEGEHPGPGRVVARTVPSGWTGEEPR